MTEPSEHFMRTFGGVGSPDITCSCGRRHCAPDSEFIDEVEQSTMEAAARASKNVILHRCADSVYAKEIGGMPTVDGCPCNWLAKFESLLWRERTNILSYYRKRAEAAAAVAAETAAGIAAAEQQVSGVAKDG